MGAPYKILIVSFFDETREKVPSVQQLVFQKLGSDDLQPGGDGKTLT